MQVPKWRNVLIVKNYLIPALSQSNLNTSSVASIHSTATSCDRSKNKGKTVSSWKLQVPGFYRKFRRDTSGEDSDDPESMFQAKFGNKWYTWSFHQGFASQRSNTESAHWTWKRSQECGNASEPESDRESPIVVGSFSDRRTLGLPLSGPLEIEEVKNAFRESALKWHPDRHQVYSQATAAEKFKLCVSAYKSLCSALS
ncbi:unnamed protein product [Linum tenue]|uniref:J domain-containing protein n=1 Tax=Linum tenue TaxID=586396 RepID=A0AAV0L1C3_9ROSI|nr:unnamed protein product [Linum tenue]